MRPLGRRRLDNQLQTVEVALSSVYSGAGFGHVQPVLVRTFDLLDRHRSLEGTPVFCRLNADSLRLGMLWAREYRRPALSTRFFRDLLSTDASSGRVADAIMTHANTLTFSEGLSRLAEGLLVADRADLDERNDVEFCARRSDLASMQGDDASALRILEPALPRSKDADGPGYAARLADAARFAARAHVGARRRDCTRFAERAVRLAQEARTVIDAQEHGPFNVTVCLAEAHVSTVTGDESMAWAKLDLAGRLTTTLALGRDPVTRAFSFVEARR